MTGGAAEGPVLIAGAGIGGLTLALALARHGIESRLLEREHSLSEVGAGIQLSPNASRILLELGLEGPVRSLACEPEFLRIAGGLNGRALAELPLAKAIAARHGAPYFVIHRADLQQILLDAVRGTPGIELLLGEPVQSYQQNGSGLSALTPSDSHVGRALIGADGVRSAVRAQLAGDGVPAFSGFVAWRGVCEAAAISAELRNMTGLWLSPRAHLVHYPLRQDALLNVVAVVQEEEGRVEQGATGPLRQHYSNWCAEARSIIALISDWYRWPLYERPPLQRWVDDRVALLGDAAHPMLPFLAQGGAMAIEDAWVLAQRLARSTDVPAALADYANARRQRTARAQTEARSNGRIYHLPRPLSLLRDAVLMMRPAGGLAERQEWIYGWRADTCSSQDAVAP